MPKECYLKLATSSVRVGDRIHLVPGAAASLNRLLNDAPMPVKSIKTGTKYATFANGVDRSIRVPRGDEVYVIREEPTEDEQRAHRDKSETELLQCLLQQGLDEESRLRGMLHRLADTPSGPFLDHGQLHDLLLRQHKLRFFQQVQARLDETASSRDIVDAFAWVIHLITRTEGYDNPLNGPTSRTVRLERDLQTYTARRFLQGLDYSTAQQDTILHRRLHQLQERGN